MSSDTVMPKNLAKKALMMMSERSMPPTPANYALAYRLAQQTHKGCEDQITLSELVICAQLMDAIMTRIPEGHILRGDLERLRSAITSDAPISEQILAATQIVETLFHSSPDLFHDKEIETRFRNSVASLYDGIVDAMRNINQADLDMPRYGKRISECKSVEDAVDVLNELSGCIKGLSETFKKTHDALSETQKCLDESNIELDRARSRAAQLESKAETDPMTGLLNRRGLDKAVKDLPQAPCSIILFDIDDFKKINDTLGHAVGDQAIIALANIARDGAREQDKVVRLGGEEIAVLLPNCNLINAEEVAQRIMKRLAHWCGEKVARKLGLKMTVSGGLASWYNFKQNAETQFAHILEVADRNLYRAKRDGKNRLFAG